IMGMETDIENMTINEYLEYEAKMKSDWEKKFIIVFVNINDLEKEEAQVEDGDDGDICDIWDIIREFLTPNVPDVMDDVIQPLIPKTIHTTPPDKDCVAPATKPILDELLEEFREEMLNVTMVDEEADFNPTKDIEELERLLAKDP
ncbi:hypothetical protein Tco_0900268, partial [Tanacetum coccineum]